MLKHTTQYIVFLCIFIAEFVSENAHEIMRNNSYVFSTSYKTINGFAMISDLVILFVNSTFYDSIEEFISDLLTMGISLVFFLLIYFPAKFINGLTFQKSKSNSQTETNL